MRLLLDQNLSHRLKGPLGSVFAGIAHVRDFGLERADDSPPKVIWLRLGNCATSDIESVLRGGHAVITAFLVEDAASLLTLSRSSE